MTKKALNYTFLFLLLGSLTITNWGCEKISGEEEEPEGTITAEKSSVKSGEVAMLIADFNITDGLHEASFNDTVIDLNAIDNALYFVVPNVNSGYHNIFVDIQGTEFIVELSVIANVSISDPNQYIIDIENEIIALIQNTIEFNNELVIAGLMTTGEAQANSTYWNYQIVEIKQQLSSLPDAEKLEFAQMYTANKEWIDEFMAMTSVGYFKNTNDCGSIWNEGKIAHDQGELYTASYYALRYKFCKLETMQKVSTFVNKVTTLLSKINPLSYMATVWNMVVSPIIDRLSKELGINKDECVGDEIEEDKKASYSFVNNAPNSIDATIRYRTINESDINSGNSFSTFAVIYNQFISAFNSFISLSPENNAFPPSFANSTKSIPFNRFMEIKNISNPNVSLKSSNIVDDNWEIVFKTDETEDQQFTYDLVYNDGKTQLSKQISATLTVVNPLLGEWEAFELNGIPIGTWTYNYYGACPNIIITASRLNVQILNIAETSLILSDEGEYKSYNYINLDYTNCTYDSFTTETQPEGGSWNLSYSYDGNTMTFFNYEGSLVVFTYEIQNNNNTLILSNEFENYKYHRK